MQTTVMHNVRLERIRTTTEAVSDDPAVARLDIDLSGEWRADDSLPQFGGPVKFGQGEVTLEADFPRFFGGDGRAPSPLMYCFYGAMSCYAVTFATQAAMAGVALRALSIGLRLSVDFRTALGLGEYPPMSEFAFELAVDTDASEEQLERLKRLADERCPAIWAMKNSVPHSTSVSRA